MSATKQNIYFHPTYTRNQKLTNYPVDSIGKHLAATWHYCMEENAN